MQFHTRDNDKKVEKKSTSSNDYEQSFESLLGKAKITEDVKKRSEEE